MPFVDPILENALRQSAQGGLLRLTGAHRVYPTCNCCISGNTVGVYKDPVPILDVSDQDICTYESVSVSFDGSFSASSTLQLWSVDWGDGYTSNGAWPPAASVSHPAGGYVLPGNYVIILTITDLLGATGTAAVDVYVDDCWVPMAGFEPEFGIPTSPAAHQLIISRKYDDDAYWTDDVTANPPVWNNQKNDANKGKYVIMPSLTTRRFFGYGWGVYEYSPLPFDTGAWSTKFTEAQLAGLFGHGGDYVECYIFRMIFSANPSHEEWAWAGVYLWWDDGTDHILYGIIHTSDAWSHTQYARTILELDEGVDFEDVTGPCQECDIGYDEHGDHLYMLLAKAPEDDGGAPASATIGGWWRLYWSQDYGYVWYLGQEKNYTWGDPYYDIDLYDMNCSIWIPWRDNEFNGGTIYWTVCLLQEADVAFNYNTVPLIYYSHNFALSYTDISDDGSGNPGHALSMLKGPWNSIHRVYGVYQIEDSHGDVGKVWTFRGDPPAYGWTLFRNTSPHADECRAMIVYEQTGYALKTLLATCDPRWITSAADTDKQRPNDDSFWAVWIP